MPIVRVRLRKASRVMPFLANGIVLRRGNECVVQTDRGLEYGVCLLPPMECSPETSRSLEKYKVVSRATEQDRQTCHQVLLDEARARDIAKRKIDEKRLPMKLVDAEYTFDRRKVVIYFTAEQRVDFRDLVRELAQTLKTRIELRHIQVRDKARLVGGIGECGRLLCCREWMPEFVPISMKMAKKQHLSLNPEKISGQCGRLMCCLCFEDDNYDGGTTALSEKTGEGPQAAQASRQCRLVEQAPAVAESADEPPPDAGRPDEEAHPETDADKQQSAEAAPDKPSRKKKSRRSKKRRNKRRRKKAENKKPKNKGNSTGNK